ncbi:MAG TPA: hypothetical protein VL401_02050 [Alphaproteobacteria bacterium]|jgi:hypothetical protein|nr:hypothetical protein [Alphaproteobacteria bacterium]
MLSIKYHKIFDYKLVKSDFPKWFYKIDSKDISKISKTKSKTRLQREKYSLSKLKLAKKAAKILAKIPTIKFVGITGSLAMMNSNKDSDIDLMIITKTGTMWTTRLLVHCLLFTVHYPLRRPNIKKQKDMLCINLWLDENDLIWNKADRNIYTAHEIAQVVPLVNKNQTYEKFLWENKWILDFWPNAIDRELLAISNKPLEKPLIATGYSLITSIVEKIAFKLQYFYMRKKITRETITPTKALFHPQDWGKVVLEKLNK